MIFQKITGLVSHPLGTPLTDYYSVSEEEMDLLIKWLGSESAKLVRKIRAVHVGHPSLSLCKVWERLEECFGSPEVIEKSFINRLENFQKINNKV